MSTEVLGPRLSKAEARPLIQSCKRHWRAAHRGTLLACAEMRKLQEGEAHLEYGYSNFAHFCVTEVTPELTEGQAKKFSWRGAPLLALERHGRLSLAERATLPVGTTGAQALASILNQQGEEKMLEVYDLARSLKPGPVSDVTVKRAARELLPERTPTSDATEALEVLESESEPYASEQDEPYDPAQLPDELEQTRLVLEDLISGMVHAEPEPSERDRTAAMREIKAIRARLDQLADTLGSR
jgi:hypothetical protein